MFEVALNGICDDGCLFIYWMYGVMKWWLKESSGFILLIMNKPKNFQIWTGWKVLIKLEVVYNQDFVHIFVVFPFR